MSQLITTISVLGDDAVMNSLIDGSLTEFVDDIATDVGQYAFYDRFDNLNTIHLQNVITIKKYSFKKCRAKEVILPSIQYIDKSSDYFGSSKIEKYDFTALKEISTGSSTSSYRPFYGCNDIKAFIIRNPEMCTISGSYSPFYNSSIGTIGYIYVPKNLVESYKTASVWSDYADHIRAIEDYPEVCDTYSWAAVAKTVENGTYKDVYKIGDCVPLDLGSNGIINMQIVAFDTDDLADGSGKAHITWIAKETIEFKGVTGQTPHSCGGWSTSPYRTYCNETIKALIPDIVLQQIKTVTKYQLEHDEEGCGCSGLQNAKEASTNDDIWIPSDKEVGSNFKAQHYGACPTYGYALLPCEPNGHHYDNFFSSDNSNSRIKKDVSGTTKQWLLRSTNNNPSTNYWRVVKSNGQVSYQTYGDCVIGFCT